MRLGSWGLGMPKYPYEKNVTSQEAFWNKIAPLKSYASEA